MLGVDARHRRAALVHYAVLLQLGKAQALFALAHAAVDAAPKDALSWYAVGCYYLAAHKPVQAVKHFTRATQFDPAFAPAWGGLGQAFAVQDEPEPALAAYRAAMKLWPASHLPPLAMASLCVRTGQLVLAQQHASLAQGGVGAGTASSGAFCATHQAHKEALASLPRPTPLPNHSDSLPRRPTRLS